MARLLVLAAVALAAGAAYPDPAPAQYTCDASCQAAQTKAMTEFYHSTNGPHWLQTALTFPNGTAVPGTQWLGPTPLCYWAGLACCPPAGYITPDSVLGYTSSQPIPCDVAGGVAAIM